MTNFKYIAFYDLDHTVLAGNSANYLVKDSIERGMMTRKEYRRAIWFSILYKLRIGDPARMITRMLEWLEGNNEKELNEFGEEIFQKALKDIFRPEILATIEEHRAQGAGIVLLSSAPHPVCKPVVDHMKLDDLICTELEAHNGIFTGKPVRPIVYDREKEVRMLEYCHEKAYKPADAWYYGDSYTDQHVMKAVGHAVAVAPDKGLLKIATDLNWPVLAERK